MSLKDAIRAATPRARLQRHREFWGENPPPDVASQLCAVERILLLPGDNGKATRVLQDLDEKRSRQPRKVGAARTNTKFAKAKKFARQEASELVAADTLCEREKSDIVEQVTTRLIEKRLYSPAKKVLWAWLTAPPSVIPAYMRKGGRPKNQ